MRAPPAEDRHRRPDCRQPFGGLDNPAIMPKIRQDSRAEMVCFRLSGSAIGGNFCFRSLFFSMSALLLVDVRPTLSRIPMRCPDLRNRQNEPTGAVVGVLNMLRRLENDARQRTSCTKALRLRRQGQDLPRRLVSRLQANRPPMPDDLVRQIEPLACLRRGVSAGRW